MTVAYYVGGTGTGKTTLMMSHARDQAGSRAVPLILLDSEGVVPWADATAATVEDLARLVWKEGKHARYHPGGQEEVGVLSDMIRASGRVVLAIDEVSYWARGNQAVPELIRLARVHRHSEVDIYGSSQYPADISPLVWNVKSEVFVFRNESRAALDRLSDELDLSNDDEDTIRRLPDHRYVRFGRGRVDLSLPSSPELDPEEPEASPPVTPPAETE